MNSDEFEGELWADIPGFLGYEISTHGRVRSWKKSTPKLLCYNWSGRPGWEYLSVEIYADKKKRKLLVHKLMYLSFIGEIEIGFQVDHIDNNRLNNTLDNLQLISIEDNLNKRTGKFQAVEDCQNDMWELFN